MNGIIAFIVINVGLGAACLLLNRILSAISDRILPDPDQETK